MTSIASYQQRGRSRIDSDSAALDIDLLLSHVIGRSRSYLYAYPEYELDGDQCSQLDTLLERRCSGEPIAHLTGCSEFWSLPLKSTPATLIPRPDTECVVETLLQLFPQDQRCSVLDLGTGTGAIALALASERPRWDVTAFELNVAAVALAKENAQRLGLEHVCIVQSDWYSAATTERFDIIVSNPPYIEEGDPHLEQGDLRYEPRSALVAGADGLDDIRRIARDAGQYLRPGGILVLEHGYRQAQPVATELNRCGFEAIECRQDYGGNPRVSFGWWPKGQTDAG